MTLHAPLPAPAAAPAPVAPAPAPTLAAALRAALRTHTGTALRVPDPGGRRDVTYAELGARVDAIARGLIALGVAPGERVAIGSRTRAEWTCADLAALLAGAVVVPVYETSSPEEARYVLEHSGARLLFAEDARTAAAMTGADRPPALTDVVLFDGAGDDAARTLDDLAALGGERDDGELDARLAALRAEDPVTIVYTSGTTGPPKGCVLTQANLLRNGEMVLDRLPMGPDDVVFAFLPLAHVLTRAAQLTALRSGATIAYWRRDMARVLDDLAEVRPTILPSVPRVFEKAHAKALAAAAAGGPARRAVFRAALAVGGRTDRLGRRARSPWPPQRLAHRAAERLVLGRVRAVFGGRLRVALTGGAPIEPEIVRFFGACGVPVVEGYGMTETSAVSTLNEPGRPRPGTVGPPLRDVKVRIAPDGEVLVRGPHVFAGYFRDEEATAAVLDADGWLRTGDLGRLDAAGALVITGRKKDLIITSSGKNIAPALIEGALRRSPWIGQALVHGDRRPYLVALVALDPAEAPGLARELGETSDDPAVLAGRPAVRRAVQEAVAEANARFAPIEQVKRVMLLDHELTVEAGELTPTLKVKRAAVAGRRAADLERLYGDAPGPADLWLDRPA
jgi:long-chain acyl-CoA synthetase